MQIHGIRPELQPSAIAQASQNAAQDTLSQNTLNEKIVQQAAQTNHEAPGVDEVDTSAITGLGTSLNITA